MTAAIVDGVLVELSVPAESEFRAGFQPVPTLAVLKAAKKREVTARLAIELAVGFAHGGGTFKVADDAAGNPEVDSARAAAIESFRPGGAAWDANTDALAEGGVLVPLPTAAAAIALYQAMLVFRRAKRLIRTAHFTAINPLANAAEVANYDITTGW